MDEIDYSLFVPNVHFEKIPICDLVSNQDYQRALSKDHILKTAENFDLYQINPAKVSRRDGLNYVFDGQHTIEIVALVSGSRETPVWCMVYDDMGAILKRRIPLQISKSTSSDYRHMMYLTLTLRLKTQPSKKYLLW